MASKWILLFLSQCLAVGGIHFITSCNKTMDLVCENQHQIVVKRIETSSNSLQHFQGRCNSQQQCLVENPSGECVNMTYWCKLNINNYPKMEIMKSSNFKLKGIQYAFELMSEGYTNRQSQDAENVKCKVRLSKPIQESNRLKLDVYELSSSDTKIKYCLILKDSIHNVSVCSSTTLFDDLSLNSNDWEISLIASQMTTPSPKVRFWMELSFTEMPKYDLECSSSSGRADNNTDGKEHDSPVRWILGILIFVLLLGNVGLALRVFQLHAKIKHFADHFYDEISQPNKTQQERALPIIPGQLNKDNVLLSREIDNCDSNKPEKQPGDVGLENVHDIITEVTVTESHVDLSSNFEFEENEIYSATMSANGSKSEISSCPADLIANGNPKRAKSFETFTSANETNYVEMLMKKIHSCNELSGQERSDKTGSPVYELCKSDTDK